MSSTRNSGNSGEMSITVRIVGTQVTHAGNIIGTEYSMCYSCPHCSYIVTHVLTVPTVPCMCYTHAPYCSHALTNCYSCSHCLKFYSCMSNTCMQETVILFPACVTHVPTLFLLILLFLLFFMFPLLHMFLLLLMFPLFPVVTLYSVLLYYHIKSRPKAS